jgi:hypothetical protein
MYIKLTSCLESNVSVAGLVAGQQDKLRPSDAKANHSLWETRKDTQSESLEGIGVELSGGSEVSLGDSDENVSDRHCDGLKGCELSKE